jgi:hypothetical protein
LKNWRGQLLLVAAPAGEDGAVAVHQDARFLVANLEGGDQMPRANCSHRPRPRDGVVVEDAAAITVEADTGAEFLLFDLG